MRRAILAAAFTAAALFQPQAVRAAEIIQYFSLNSGPPAFRYYITVNSFYNLIPFDPKLGTLTAVEATATTDFTYSIQGHFVPNSPKAGISVFADGFAVFDIGDIGMSIAYEVPFVRWIDPAKDLPITETFHTEKTVRWADPALIESFLSMPSDYPRYIFYDTRNSFDFDFVTSDAGDGGRSTAFAAATLQIKYIYTSAVPEVSTWSMLIVGLAGLGGTLRWRHRAAILTKA